MWSKKLHQCRVYLVSLLRRSLHWHISQRILFGVILIVGGIFGALPVLGFWMIPLGIIILLPKKYATHWLEKTLLFCGLIKQKIKKSYQIKIEKHRRKKQIKQAIKREKYKNKNMDKKV